MAKCPSIPASAIAFQLSLLVPMGLPAEDWPQWRGKNRDGVWHEAGVLEEFPSKGLKAAWRVPVGRGWSSPVVAEGRVYLTDVEIRESRATERVLCFDAATGKPQWIHQYAVNYPVWAFDPNAGGPRATPIIKGGKLYTLGALGHLFCLEAASGNVVWKKDLASEYGVKEFTGISSSPLIEDQLLILYMCGKPDACVVALNKDTGAEAWKALDDSFTYSSPIVLTAGGQRQLIVWTQEGVTSLNPATGQVWWRELLRTSGDQAVSTPVHVGPYLLVGGLMLKLDSEKPASSILWPESKAPSKRVLSNTSTALLRDAFVFSAKTSGELVCLEAATGKEIWQANTVTAPGNGSSIHITATEDSVLLFTDEGNLILARLSGKGYEEISRVHLLDPTYSFGTRKVAWTPPSYANGHVFARNDKELVCFSLESKSAK